MEASPSKLLHFRECRRYWREGAYGPAGAPAQSGKEFHGAVAGHALHLLQDPKSTTSPAFFLETQDEDIRADALDLLALYQSDKRWQPDPEVLLSVEAHDSTFMHPTLNKPVYKTDLGGGHILTGIPDRVSMKKDFLLIDDWKTGFAVGDDPFQLSCYAVLCSDQFGVTKVKGRFCYIRLGMIIPYWYDKCDIEHHRYRVRAMIEEMDQAVKEKCFPESVCNSCGYCSLKSCCREYAKALADETLPPPPIEGLNMVQLLGEDKAMGAREKIYKKAGDAYSEIALAKIGKGKVLLEGNTQYSIREIPSRYEFDIMSVIQLFTTFGLVGALPMVLEAVPGKIEKWIERADVRAELGARYEDFYTAVMMLKKVKSLRRKIEQKPAGNSKALEQIAKEAEETDGKEA